MRPFTAVICSLLLLPVLAATSTAADGDAANGVKLLPRCSACHSITGQNKIGPSLAGVFGRKAASVDGFRYSKALAASDITWDDGTLDGFLAAPSKLVPGTSMIVNLPKPEDRADMIAYLKTLKAP